jgi:dTDP-4-amino-4,6-dideoxygalactose transaminase
MNIPLVNLKRMHEPIRQEIDDAVKEVIDANNYINGRQIEEFESDFAQHLGVKAVVGVSSGTDAIFLALKALQIKQDDCVITVPNTFIATTEAITMAGARVIFIDVDEHSSNMSPEKLDIFLESANKNVIENVKAIVFVNLYGNPEGLDKIYHIARRYNISLISDAAQAHGARINGKPITDFADITTYSFYPGKNLGAFGDAGAVAVNDTNTAKTFKMLRNHGRTEKYLHPLEAYNCRIDTIQAAVLKVKLKYLDLWNENRVKTAAFYNQLLEKKGYFVPSINRKYKPVFHLHVTRVKNREEIIKQLKADGVSTGIHYPVPLHLQQAYKYLEYREGDFPVSEALAKEILSLPIDGAITAEEVEYICNLLP